MYIYYYTAYAAGASRTSHTRSTSFFRIGIHHSVCTRSTLHNDDELKCILKFKTSPECLIRTGTETVFNIEVSRFLQYRRHNILFRFTNNNVIYARFTYRDTGFRMFIDSHTVEEPTYTQCVVFRSSG